MKKVEVTKESLSVIWEKWSSHPTYRGSFLDFQLNELGFKEPSQPQQVTITYETLESAWGVYIHGRAPLCLKSFAERLGFKEDT